MRKISLSKPIKLGLRSEPTTEIEYSAIAIVLQAPKTMRVDGEDVDVPEKRTLAWSIEGLGPHGGGAFRETFSKSSAPPEVWAAIETILAFADAHTKKVIA